MEVTTYTVTAERGTHRWILQCEQYPAALSEVARLDQAADHMREAIAFVAGVPEDEITIELIPQLPHAIAEDAQRAHELREQAEEIAQQASQRWRAAAKALREQGLTVRDIGFVLGVSYQRAQQLVRARGMKKHAPQP